VYWVTLPLNNLKKIFRPLCRASSSGCLYREGESPFIIKFLIDF
jgi:hypothetical protein